MTAALTGIMSGGVFSGLTVAEPIENFFLSTACAEDKHPRKVDLALGVFRDNNAQPWVLPVVRSVEKQILLDQTLNHEYLPVAGQLDYRQAGVRLLLGEDSNVIVQNRVDSVQTVGGTGALMVGLEFLKSRLYCDTLYISKPAYENYRGIARHLRYFHIKEYRYWDAENRCLDFKGMLDDLSSAPIRSVVILQMCGHNQTGLDPTHEQWQAIADVCKERSLFVFFDSTYQGLASGDFSEDAWPVRYFSTAGIEFFAAQSFSKNFGLYDGRVGQLVFVVSSSDLLAKIRTQMISIIRETWSNPSAHGARIVSTVLQNPALYAEWKANVKTMSERIIAMRRLLYFKLKALGAPGRWDHLLKQTGFFCYTALNTVQIDYLRSHYHIYMTKDGRISICGVTTSNVDYVASAFHDVVMNLHAITSAL